MALVNSTLSSASRNSVKVNEEGTSNGCARQHVQPHGGRRGAARATRRHHLTSAVAARGAAVSIDLALHGKGHLKITFSDYQRREQHRGVR